MPICINFGSNLLKLIAIVTLRKRLEDRRIFMNWSLLKVPSLPANLTTLVRLEQIYSKKFSISGSAMMEHPSAMIHLVFKHFRTGVDICATELYLNFC